MVQLYYNCTILYCRTSKLASGYFWWYGGVLYMICSYRPWYSHLQTHSSTPHNPLPTHTSPRIDSYDRGTHFRCVAPCHPDTVSCCGASAWAVWAIMAVRWVSLLLVTANALDNGIRVPPMVGYATFIGTRNVCISVTCCIFRAGARGMVSQAISTKKCCVIWPVAWFLLDCEMQATNIFGLTMVGHYLAIT